MIIEQELNKELNLIIDNYLKLNTPLNNIKKYLDKNVDIIINNLYDIEKKYLDKNKDKTYKDFKNYVKKSIKLILLDREYYYKDHLNESTLFKSFLL
jgi:hypothetical protein